MILRTANRALGLGLVLLATGAGAQASSLPPLTALFEQGEFEKARLALTQALEGPLPPEDEGRARLYLAASHFALGDRPAASAHLRLLAERDPGGKLDPALFSPGFIALAQDARGQVRAERAPKAASVPHEVLAAAAEPPARQSTPWLRYAAVGSAGVAAALGVNSLVFAVSSNQARAQVQALPKDGAPVDSLSQRNAEWAAGRAGNHASVALASAVGAGLSALLSGGLFWASSGQP